MRTTHDAIRLFDSACRESFGAAEATEWDMDSVGTTRMRRRHTLRAESLMEWEYRSYDLCGAVLEHRIGTRSETVRTAGGMSASSQVPAEFDSDDPGYFHAWMANIPGWIIEMIRPVDLLARSRIRRSEVDPETGVCPDGPVFVNKLTLEV